MYVSVYELVSSFWVFRTSSGVVIIVSVYLLRMKMKNRYFEI